MQDISGEMTPWLGIRGPAQGNTLGVLSVVAIAWTLNKTYTQLATGCLAVSFKDRRRFVDNGREAAFYTNIFALQTGPISSEEHEGRKTEGRTRGAAEGGPRVVGPGP
jgi:hypothetical protein